MADEADETGPHRTFPSRWRDATTAEVYLFDANGAAVDNLANATEMIIRHLDDAGMLVASEHLIPDPEPVARSTGSSRPSAVGRTPRRACPQASSRGAQF